MVFQFVNWFSNFGTTYRMIYSITIFSCLSITFVLVSVVQRILLFHNCFSPYENGKIYDFLSVLLTANDDVYSTLPFSFFSRNKDKYIFLTNFIKKIFWILNATFM